MTERAKLTPEERIERWKVAYRLANWKEPPLVSYKGGWYSIGRPPTKWRASDMESAIGRLQYNASLRAQETSHD